MALSKGRQLAQAFAVSNRSEHCAKFLLEAPDGLREEFTLLPREDKVVNMRSQHGRLSAAFCEIFGNRFTLAICQERVPVQAGIHFSVSSQDRHTGNRRYEKLFCNATDLVRTFSKMSLACALAETCRGTPPLIAHPCPAVTPDLIQSSENTTCFHKQDFFVRLPSFAEHMGTPEAGQMAQVFTVVNQTEHPVKCLFEAPDGGQGEEFMLLRRVDKVVDMRSQHGLLSVAFCENEGNRFSFGICQERVPVQAGIPFFVSPQDKNVGNRRYKKTLCNTTDLVRTFTKMSLARALAE